MYKKDTMSTCSTQPWALNNMNGVTIDNNVRDKLAQKFLIIPGLTRYLLHTEMDK
jgi:hypothetical protein